MSSVSELVLVLLAAVVTLWLAGLTVAVVLINRDLRRRFAATAWTWPAERMPARTFRLSNAEATFTPTAPSDFIRHADEACAHTTDQEITS